MKNNIYRQAEFSSSAHNRHQFAADLGSEVAFAGRSNSGKSSVINTITGKKGLARVSKTPGRTQLINFFTVTQDIRLVDLPGYGYAKVPDKLKQHWGKLVNSYFDGRKSLRGLVLIVDIRRQLTDFDERMLDWCRDKGIPVHILLNKSDKLSFGVSKQVLLKISRQLGGQDVSVQLFSALKKTGIEGLCTKLNSWLL